MGETTPGTVILGAKKAGSVRQEMQTSKQPSSVASISSCLQVPSLLVFLSCLPSAMEYDINAIKLK